MPPPTHETLRDLLSLLRSPPDDSADARPSSGQDVGPYRSERETLEAQIREEMRRLEMERALLDERRALLRAVQAAAAPSRFPRPFFRALALGAILGTASSLTTFVLLLAPSLGHLSPVTLNPPSAWGRHERSATVVVPPAPPATAMVLTTTCARPPWDGAHDAFEDRITQLSPTIWDVDRRLLRDPDLAGTVRLGPTRAAVGAGIFGVRRGSLSSRLGLLNGDTLIAVNGRVVTPGETFEPHDFDRVTRIELALVRRGEPMTFTYLLR